MIRHCVFVRFRADVTEEARKGIYAELKSLREVVPGFLAMSAGPNISPEGLHKGFTEGFVIDFADETARDTYLVHPAHQAAGGRLVAALDGGIDGVIVFDIAV